MTATMTGQQSQLFGFQPPKQADCGLRTSLREKIKRIWTKTIQEALQSKKSETSPFYPPHISARLQVNNLSSCYGTWHTVNNQVIHSVILSILGVKSQQL